MRTLPLLAITLASVACVRAEASSPKSFYTTLELPKCTDAKQADGRAWICRGIDGWPVLIAEDRRHTFVSVGPDADKRHAATQTLHALNSPFHDSSKRATLEWRFETRGGKKVPYAVILRYWTEAQRTRGEVLVVYRVAKDDTCQVAWIDALANPDAIAIARKIADTTAKTADCKSTAAIAGKQGRSPM